MDVAYVLLLISISAFCYCWFSLLSAAVGNYFCCPWLLSQLPFASDVNVFAAVFNAAVVISAVEVALNCFSAVPVEFIPAVFYLFLYSMLQTVDNIPCLQLRLSKFHRSGLKIQRRFLLVKLGIVVCCLKSLFKTYCRLYSNFVLILKCYEGLLTLNFSSNFSVSATLAATITDNFLYPNFICYSQTQLPRPPLGTATSSPPANF